MGNLLNSLTRTPKKALLMVHEKPAGEVSSADLAKKTEAMLSNPITAAFAMLGGASGKVLEVQYNPRSLSLQANATPITMGILQSNLDGAQPTQHQRPPSVTLSVELIFDDVNIKDAFMLEKFGLSPSDILSSATGIVKNLFGDGYTVQPQTNALVALIMREETRRVSFSWADMTFTGEVKDVQARYTMFSVSGKPVRSSVKLSIEQQVDGLKDGKYWDNAFDNCFEEPGLLDAVAGAAKAAGNLLHVSI